jgi:hypothetical protein
MPKLAKDVPYQVSEAAANGTLIHSMVEAQLKDRIPDVWGTADAIIIGKNRLVVCDLISGKFPVEAKDNTQLMIYGLGALSRYGNEDTTMELTIVQPRGFHPDGPVRTWDISAVDLVEWGYESLARV